MMLEVAIEEELTAFLGRDYYERRNGQEGSRNGSKPRTIKIGCGDIEIEMPKVRDAGRPFHSELLPLGVTRMEEIQDIIPFIVHEWHFYEKGKEVGSEAFRQEGIESSEHNTDYREGSRGIQAMEEAGFNRTQSSVFNP
jgi:hypothetical protein